MNHENLDVRRVKQKIARQTRYEGAMRAALDRPPFLKSDGRYPSRDAVHERGRRRRPSALGER
jgi:hypothetical protein